MERKKQIFQGKTAYFVRLPYVTLLVAIQRNIIYGGSDSGIIGTNGAGNFAPVETSGRGNFPQLF